MTKEQLERLHKLDMEEQEDDLEEKVDDEEEA